MPQIDAIYIAFNTMTTTAIRHSELRSALQWYFESKNLAIKNALELLCPLSPEQQKELRQYYSEYFVSLVSATELLCESNYEFSIQFKDQLHNSLSFEKFPDGKGNYDYLRELRNSIVHRGLDICSAGRLYENRLLLLAPATVSDRNGKKSFPAFGNYLIEIIAKCEESIGPLIAEHLDRVGLLKPLLTQEQAKTEAIRYLAGAAAAPDWIKQNASNFISQLDFVQVQTSAIEKLIDILKFNALFSENENQPCNAPDLAQKSK